MTTQRFSGVGVRAIDAGVGRPAVARRVWDHLGGWPGLALRLGLVALAVATATQHVMRGDSLVVLLAIAVPGALLARRAAVPLAVYTAAWLLFSLLRAGMDDIGLPDQGATIAAIDRLLAGGLTPTERLQEAFYTPGALGGLDVAAIWTHTSYYVMPHFAAVGLFWAGRRWRDMAAFRAYLAGSIALMAIGLLLYAALPTAPPWIQGTVEDEMRVHRITRASNAGATRDPDQVYTFFTDPNPIAALPSLHTAITVLMALVLWRVNRVVGAFAWLYALAMGFSLVYLGEHYLIDVLLGAALAVGVGALLDWWSARRAR
jgi:membrane-associated phospholipid phosphatase